ncbi:MAG: winged helix-turn-helix domain-containing protein [Actinomycetota bacterium]
MRPDRPPDTGPVIVDGSGVPTVLLVGEHALDQAPAFLRLGAVVVVAPDRGSLDRWQCEQGGGDGRARVTAADDSIVVDLRKHSIEWRDVALDITELEFRVLAALASEPDRAWSFPDLRATGWGPATPTRDDLVTVRSVVQRLRNKLRVAGVLARIETVRGFGFRLTMQPPAPRSVPDLRRSGSVTT